MTSFYRLVWCTKLSRCMYDRKKGRTTLCLMYTTLLYNSTRGCFSDLNPWPPDHTPVVIAYLLKRVYIFFPIKKGQIINIFKCYIRKHKHNMISFSLIFKDLIKKRWISMLYDHTRIWWRGWDSFRLSNRHIVLRRFGFFLEAGEATHVLDPLKRSKNKNQKKKKNPQSPQGKEKK